MKKFTIRFVLPVITSLAAVGSGFWAWAFEKESKSKPLPDIEVIRLAKWDPSNRQIVAFCA